MSLFLSILSSTSYCHLFEEEIKLTVGPLFYNILMTLRCQENPGYYKIACGTMNNTHLPFASQFLQKGTQHWSFRPMSRQCLTDLLSSLYTKRFKLRSSEFWGHILIASFGLTLLCLCVIFLLLLFFPWCFNNPCTPIKNLYLYCHLMTSSL